LKFSFDTPPKRPSSFGNSKKTANTSSTSNEKLKKAIERNRVRIAKKQGKKTIELSSRQTSRGKGPSWSVSRPQSKDPPATKETSRRLGSTRGEYQFSTSLRKSPARPPAKIGYIARKKQAISGLCDGIKDKFRGILVYLGWAFCFFLLFRLVFTDRGVLDFYSRQKVYDGKVKNLEIIKKESAELGRQIEHIKSNRIYQKKLVRDHLGFISEDEFLILFPKEKKVKSI